MEVITVHFPEQFLLAINEIVRAGKYPNRSEVIRMAVRDLLQSELPRWILPSAKSKARRECARVYLEVNRENMDALSTYIEQNREHSKWGRMTTPSEIVNRALEFFFKTARQNGVLAHD